MDGNGEMNFCENAKKKKIGGGGGRGGWGVRVDGNGEMKLL